MKGLCLNHSRVTGAGLVHLGGMTGLRRLVLGWTRVDDLAPIGHLTSLNQLMLAECPIGGLGASPGREALRVESPRVGVPRGLPTRAWASWRVCQP